MTGERRCAHGRLFTESCEGCGYVHPRDRGMTGVLDLGEPFRCTAAEPWTPGVVAKLVLHPAARRPLAEDGLPPGVERYCPICTYAWVGRSLS